MEGTGGRQRTRLADSYLVGGSLSMKPLKIADYWRWVDATIDVKTKLLLDIKFFSRRGNDPAAAFLYRLIEKYDNSDAAFLVDNYGYLTVLSRLDLSCQLDYPPETIPKWGLTHSKCEPSASIRDGWAVGWLLTDESLPSDATTTAIDHIRVSIDERLRSSSP